MPGRLRKLQLNFASISLGVLGLSLLLFPSYRHESDTATNYLHLYLNGEDVGDVASMEDAKACLQEARRNIAAGSDDLVYAKADLTAEGSNVLWGPIDSDEAITRRMTEILESSKESTLEKCYTVKFGQYTLNMSSLEDIQSLLTRVLEEYDNTNDYLVTLIQDTSSPIEVLTTSVLTSSEQDKQEEIAQRLPTAGIEKTLAKYFDAVEPDVSLDFSAFTLGVKSIDFGETIQIVESYMPENQISSLDEALADVTGEVDTSQTYTVQSGDTISGIAANYGLTMSELIAVNSNLESENSTIRPGDVLTVTVAEKKLTVEYVNQEYYEEDYYADTVYKDNDEWYTTKSEVVQEASAGHRRVIANVTYRDDTILSKSIVKEETVREAVPRIIERGTKNPPTFIWPVSGGATSSGFGRRSRPKAGASTYHQGVDIAVSTGTSVMASSGGKVTVAGWQRGYGYVVYIDHGNGVQTRYGHLSKILVRVGQTVTQGQVIARSGNTGNSTGPHLHFEYRVNGTAYDPRSYVTR